MSSTSQALKRLGVGTVAGCTLLAMPYVGVATAFAAGVGIAPAPTDVTITSQMNGQASPRNDGTDTTVKVTANVAYAPATPPASNAAAPGSVRFTYQPSGSTTDVLIGVDATAPYSVQWTPPAGGGTGYKLFAEALDSNGNSYTSAAKSVAQTTSIADAASVHIVAPAEGANIGSVGGNIIVSGTRSADFPALSVTAQARDNGTGVLTSAGAATTVPATTSGAKWTAIVAVPACTPTAPATTCNVVINAATASGAAESDETTEATLYSQTLTKILVTPATASFGTRTDPGTPGGARQRYTATTTDQNGAPIAGVVVLINASDSGACTTWVETRDNGLTCIGSSPFFGGSSEDVTDVAGQALFDLASSTAQTQTLTFQSDLDNDGVFEPSSSGDLSATATATTYSANATTATLAATPAKALYADNTAHNAEYTGSTPEVTLCTTDQNGNPLSNTSGSNLVVTDTRVYTSGSTTNTGTAQPAAATPVTGDPSKSNCFTVTYLAAEGDYGRDTFNAYYNNNGVSGFQPGTSDVAAAPLTLKWATLGITALDTQGQKGTATTVSFKVLGADGSPFAGRKITLTNTKTATGGFTATQPSGSTAPTFVGNNGTVIATTDANGVASATVNDTAAAPVTVTATDNVPTGTAAGQAANQVPTGETATSTVDFRTNSVALATLAQLGYTIILPSGATSSGSSTPSPNVRPGDVLEFTYRLQDANGVGGSPLLNTPVTLAIDHGYFTPNCTGPTAVASGTDDYSKCTADPAAADGAKVGTLKNLGQSIDRTSDHNGDVTFSVAIGRDAGFDQAGSVIATLTGTANGATKTAANKISFATAGITPINGGVVKIVGATATPANANKISGDVVANTGTNFVVHLTDQFGNLITLPSNAVAVSVAGGGKFVHDNGLYCCDYGSPTTTTAGSFLGDEDYIHLSSSTTSTTGQSNKVTATWTAPVTTFKGTTTPAVGSTPASTTYAVAPSSTAPLTDSFTVNLYAVDKANLTYSFTNTPGSSVPVNTAVTTSVTVKDQKGNPVQGMSVQFVRSGPNDTAGNAQTGGSTSRTTNNAGQAGTSYSSGTPGTATVTVIVTDGSSGNELSRSVQNVTFTPGTPTTNSTVSINGPASQFVKYGTRMVVTGKAPANSAVTVYFHRAYVAGLTPKAATANASGVWSVVYSAVDDFSYYAQVGSARAATVLTRIDPNVSGADRTARKGQTVTVSGKSGARSAVNVHVGSAVHAVHADANGVWTYTFKFAGTVAIFANRTEHNVHTAGITIRG